MKLLLENWKEYLKEDDSTVNEPYLKEYVALVILTMNKKLGANRTGTTKLIRAIEEVTQMKKTREITDTDLKHVGEYEIKFILPPDKNVANWTDKVLRPGLNKITGLAVNKIKKVSSID